MTPKAIHLVALLAGISSAHEGRHSAIAEGLPVIAVQTGDQLVVNRTRVRSSIMVGENATGTLRSEYSGLAEMSVRGNSSYHFNKKSYRLELQNEDGSDRKISLLGMPADSDWVLYASATDKTFVRNVLSHELWRQMGRYAVRWRFVDLHMMTNTLKGAAVTSSGWREVPLTPTAVAGEKSTGVIESSNYMGVYVLMEKVKRGKQRLIIRKLGSHEDEEPEISGGYIFKKDVAGLGERGFLTGQEFALLYVEPKETTVTAAQKRWLAKYLDDFEKTLFSLDFRDSITGYAQFLDVASFIDFHWLVEFSRNADGYWVSEYMQGPWG